MLNLFRVQLVGYLLNHVNNIKGVLCGMKKLWTVLLMGLLVLSACSNHHSEGKNEASKQDSNKQNQSHKKVKKDGKTYIDGILMVNKQIKLPKDYNPGENPKAVKALNKMIADAKKDHINLYKISGFRSYQTQIQLFNNYKARDGEKAANKYSSKPGHSEHQTGLSFDVGAQGSDKNLYRSFGKTKEGQWIKRHADEYGFIIRYGKGKENETGYQYEPWHLRYLGKEKAKEVKDSGQSLESYLGLYPKK